MVCKYSPTPHVGTLGVHSLPPHVGFILGVHTYPPVWITLGVHTYNRYISRTASQYTNLEFILACKHTYHIS